MDINGYEISPINPGWIRKKKDEKYIGTDFTRIFMFFVIITNIGKDGL